MKKRVLLIFTLTLVILILIAFLTLNLTGNVVEETKENIKKYEELPDEPNKNLKTKKNIFDKIKGFFKKNINQEHNILNNKLPVEKNYQNSEPQALPVEDNFEIQTFQKFNNELPEEPIENE